MLKVERSHDDAVVIWTIDEPRSRNALDLATMAALTAAVREAAADVALRAAILTGGGSVFVSGGDVRELRDRTSTADAEGLTDQGFALTTALAELPFPVIAALPGPAIGGGAEVALACDMRVAAAPARISFKQVRMGVTSAWGAVPRLVALVGPGTAARLLYTAYEIPASEAKLAGLVDEVVPEGGALPAAIAWAEEIARGSPTAIAGMKRVLRASLDTAADVRALERRLFVESWTGEDHKDAVEAWFARRPPAYRSR